MNTATGSVFPLKTKIPDNDLREFVGGNQPGVRSVIVEVASKNRPKQRCAESKQAKPIVQTRRLRSFVMANPSEPRMEEVAHILKSLSLKETPTRLDAAHAFAVKVDARQLKAIAEYPSVEVIRPNRVHRLGSRGVHRA